MPNASNRPAKRSRTTRFSGVWRRGLAMKKLISSGQTPKITEDVQPGLIVATLGYWRQLNNSTVNSISSAELVNMGNAPSFSDNLVQLEALQ
jgi:hypothetical protein